MKYIKTILLFLISTSMMAQFANKKDEKFYYKLDDAYLDYDYDFIIENEEKAKEIFLSKEDTVAANVYSFLGETYYYELDELQIALDYYNQELNLRNKIQPYEGHSDLKAILAGINYDLGYYGKAESLLIEAKKFDETKYGKSSETYFDTAMGLVDLYLNTEDAEKARKEILDLNKNVKKNSSMHLGVLKSLGDSYAIEGSYKRAERQLFNAIDVAQENGLETSFEYVSTLNSLAILYEDKSKLAEAEEVFLEAISLLERSEGDNEDAIQGIKGNLARVYFNLGNYEKALDLQKEVEAADKEYFGEDSFIYGVDLVNLGRTHMYAGNNAEAEEIFLKALTTFERASDGGEKVLDHGRTESLLSRLYVQTGQIDEAIKYGQSAIETYNKTLGEKNFETAFPYAALADAYMVYEELDKAEPMAKKAYDIRRKTLGADHPLFARSSRQLAFLNWKQGNSKEALKYYKETFKNYFKQINSFFPVLTEEEKATFYYTKLRPGFEQYISFIEETSLEDKELLGEIYDYQLALKGLIMYATSKVRESILSSGDQELIDKFELWISQKEQMAKLFSVTDLDIDVRNKRIDSLTNSSNALEEELSKSSDAFGKNFANKQLSWKDIRDVLEPGEAAVEMVRYRNFSTDSAGVFTDEVHYAAMVVRYDTEEYPEMIILRNGAEMEKKYLANYRNAIRFKIAENYSYRLFWEPISRRLDGINKIYFAPDGVYNQISIYTLQNSKTKNYLLDEIDLALVTNTKDLLEEAPAFEPGGKSVFFGYPEYSMGADEKTTGEAEDRGIRGVRGIRGTRSGGGKGELSRGIPRGVRGNLVRYMQSFNGLSMLPGTKKEVELIDSLYSNTDKQAEAYFLSDALEGTLKAVDNPNILHIATHGFFLELDPDEKVEDTHAENPLLRSGLILAGANTYIQQGEITAEHNGDDGILTAYEAMNMNLDKTDVVVMSACETGLGEIKNGEGVYGLQRAFQIAGADAIIMSMWTVDDDATQELMTVFYEEWLSHGDKQRAFNSAQKRIRDKYKKPYYWGAFVMIGE